MAVRGRGLRNPLDRERRSTGVAAAPPWLRHAHSEPGAGDGARTTGRAHIRPVGPVLRVLGCAGARRSAGLSDLVRLLRISHEAVIGWSRGEAKEVQT